MLQFLGFNNGVYVNPFDPARGGRNRHRGQQQSAPQRSTPNRTLTPSPQDSPHSRRHHVRIGGRSASSDVELADFESDFSAANREAYHEDVSAPKHKRARVTQVKSRRKTLFLCQLHAPFHNFLFLLYAMKCSTMHTLFFGVTGGQTPWGLVLGFGPPETN